MPTSSLPSGGKPRNSCGKPVEPFAVIVRAIKRSRRTNEAVRPARLIHRPRQAVRVIRRKPLGPLGAPSHGLFGAKSRAIRRMGRRIPPGEQKDTNHLTA